MGALAMGSFEEILASTVRTAVREEVRTAMREALAEGKPREAGEYLTCRQAGKVTNNHPDTIRRWVKAGLLPAQRSGRRLRIRRDVLERFLSQDPGGDERTPDEIADELLSRNRKG